jgi:predicted protein tyrosine phosphatase
MDSSQATYRKKVLFVCARNKIRSLTAEKMLAGSQFYDAKSRGVARDARIKLRESDIAWADIIFVMEKNHKDCIVKDFRSAMAGKEMVCLFIEDVYEPMEGKLITVLRQKLAPFLPLSGFRASDMAPGSTDTVP